MCLKVVKIKFILLLLVFMLLVVPLVATESINNNLYPCDTQENSFVVYLTSDDTFGNLHYANPGDFEDFTGRFFNDRYNSNIGSELYGDNLGQCYNYSRIKDNNDAGFFYSTYIYTYESNVVLTFESGAKTDDNNDACDGCEKARCYANFLVFKPNLTLGFDEAFTPANLEENSLNIDYTYARSEACSSSGWITNNKNTPDPITLNEPGLYLIISGTSADGSSDPNGGLLCPNDPQFCRSYVKVNEEAALTGDGYFFLNKISDRDYLLENGFNTIMPDENKYACLSIGGDWNDSVDNGKRCCGNEIEDNHLQALDEITILQCVGNQWSTTPPDELCDGDWEYACLDDFYSDNGSDGCCGDDLPFVIGENTYLSGECPEGTIEDITECYIEVGSYYDSCNFCEGLNNPTYDNGCSLYSTYSGEYSGVCLPDDPDGENGCPEGATPNEQLCINSNICDYCVDSYDYNLACCSDLSATGNFCTGGFCVPSISEETTQNIYNYSLYNDLYYLSTNDQNENQFVCSLDEADSMDLEDFENEDFSSLTWNWLDAWEESYLIHNLQLSEGNFQIASNADDWFVCNANGVDDNGDIDPDGADILGWQQDNSNSHNDTIIGNFQTLPAEGSKEGQCPAGYWFCSCIPDNPTENVLTNDCVHPEIHDFFTDESKPYFHPENKKCVASSDLCNSDKDKEKHTFEDGSTSCMYEDGPEDFCTDAEEIEKGTIYTDNTSCPILYECGGWIPLEELEFNFDINGGGFSGLALKTECGNANIGDCLGGIPTLIKLCDNFIDDDYDGYVDCEDADCFMNESCPDYQELGIEYNCTDGIDNDFDCCDEEFINDTGYCNEEGYDTNLNGLFCDSGDFNVDCNDADCVSHSSCSSPVYQGLAEFAAPKNESIICHERSGNSLFTECCDNFGLSCNNGDYYYDDYGFKVDYTTTFLGRGVSLYTLANFDKYSSDNQYIDYVRVVSGNPSSSANVILNFNNSQAPANLGLSSIDYNYYKTIEFDLVFTNSSETELIYNYINLFGEEDYIKIDKTNMHLYSNNGIQNYRWHHLIIPVTTNMKEFIEINFFIDNYGALAIDNVFFGVDKEQDYHNYMCAGAFGGWIEEFDPGEVDLEVDKLSCNNVFGNDGCDACDRMQGNDDCEITDLMIDNENNPEWYDFDPFRYVCDSYLSYGWSGTKCCGDDTSRLEKEFYWDYRGGCWNGYLIRNNQRVGDAMYFNDNLNPMNKIMFYNEYYVCDPGQTLEGVTEIGNITFNQDELETNLSFYGFDEENSYHIYNETEFNITSKDVCAIVSQDSKYYCQGNGLWMSNVPGMENDEWNASIPLILKPDPTNLLGGCCPEDRCWTGEECVHATDYEWNSSKEAFGKTFDGPEHVLFVDVNDSTGMRCVFNDTGNAIWEEAQPKYDWTLDRTGFCKHEDYCFVNEGFENNYGQRVNDYNVGIVIHGDGCCDINPETNQPFNGEKLGGVNADCKQDSNGININVSDFNCNITDCVPSGVAVTSDVPELGLFKIDNYGKYYCNEGNWTTKLSKLSDKMCEWFDCGIDEFSVACDEELILNDGEEFVFGDNISLTGACVYRNADGGVAVGYALGSELYLDGGDTSQLLLELIKGYLSYGVDNAFVDCDTTTDSIEYSCEWSNEIIENFYYDKELNVLLVTDIQGANFNSPDPTSQIIGGIVEFFYNIFYPDFVPDFFVLKGNTAYDKIYMAHKNALQLKAAQDRKYDESLSEDNIVNRMSINYSSAFNFENILTEDYQIALFEDEVIKSRNLTEEFMFNRCQDSGFLIVKKPEVRLINEDETFDKEDMLWTYLTKVLRLTNEANIPEIITGKICTFCNGDSDCNNGTICEASKCVGDLGYEGCNFDDECKLDLVCTDHICSNPNGNGGGDIPEDPNSNPNGNTPNDYGDCNVNDDCSAFGMTCVNKHCIVPSELTGPCDDNNDCNDELVCINSVCNVTSELGYSCDGNDDCVLNYICDLDICKALPGSVCKNNIDCAREDGNSYTCIAYVCTYLGDTDWYADENDDNDCDNSVVYPELIGDLCNYTFCEVDANCEGGYNCSDLGICVFDNSSYEFATLGEPCDPPGVICEEPYICNVETQICIEALALGLGDSPCYSNSDCVGQGCDPAINVCVCNSYTYECEYAVGLGDGCYGDNMCIGGECQNYPCVCPQYTCVRDLHGPCDEDANCIQELVCDNHQCLIPEGQSGCISWEDCAGQTTNCVNGVCIV